MIQIAEYKKQKRKEFKELQKENDKIRTEISTNNKLEKSDLMILINRLIENEIRQDKLCGE